VADLQQASGVGSVVIKDIASGLNWNRPGFRRLLEMAHSSEIDTVYIAHRDRLCRFAYELVEWILKKHCVRVVVVDSDQTSSSGINNPQDVQRELADDLLAITNHFVAKNNGLRSAANRRRRRRAQPTADDH